MPWAKTIKGVWFIPDEWPAPAGFVRPSDRKISVEFPGNLGAFPDTAAGANVGQAVVFATMTVPETDEQYQTVVIWDRVPDEWKLIEGEGGRRIGDEFIVFVPGETDPLDRARFAADDRQKARDAELEARKSEPATVKPAPVVTDADFGWKKAPESAQAFGSSDGSDSAPSNEDEESEPVKVGDAPAQ